MSLEAVPTFETHLFPEARNKSLQAMLMNPPRLSDFHILTKINLLYFKSIMISYDKSRIWIEWIQQMPFPTGEWEGRSSDVVTSWESWWLFQSS